MSNPDPESVSILLQILLLIFLTALNAFFSASEMAMVSLSRTKVEQKASEGDKKYINLVNILNQPSNFLSTIQIGITLINILAGASLAEALSSRLAPLLGGTTLAKTLAQIIVLAVLTYVSLVFGELYPKRIAQNLKEKMALRVAPPIQFLGKVMKPFVWLLASSTNVLSRLTPMKFDDLDEGMTRDEIEYLLNTNDEALDANEREMITGVFSLDELVAREIMVPRTDAFMIDINDDSRENITAILNETYSRVPVYDDDKDNILGILHVKKLLRYSFDHGFDDIDLREILQEPLFVPETIFVDDLMRQMRKTQNQMAVLLNEYGGVEGVVTLEDLLEEIVGEIDDETDIAEEEVFKIGENLYVVQGKMTLNDFNEEFDTHLESNDVDTIAGYFLATTGKIPAKGQQIVCKVDNDEDHFSLTSLEVSGKRVVKLRVEFDVEPEETEI
ncbi:HlyC/CorC family transporter [Lactococcus lactis]|uniref:hemolysin family protein n=1 Tax=Lactococcus TaxID=1357 RepID=UPI001CDD4E3A|nr:MULTISPECIES: hemolysin family protein [Lactococcus]MCA2389623.1 hemolysin family protein [Lactococcus sp. NH2-7C]MCT1181727.1 HlyC/CorC family transporter [Lactococcus lactis]MCT1194782.1 HlyC/CorC family transporter [Lactococcus lactis]MCT1226837.1 HlyC/CorC family transporter [Lactococcus lactis]WGV31204.1 hemolysin family protein [Lactococcus sp. NH2-7C]